MALSWMKMTSLTLCLLSLTSLGVRGQTDNTIDENNIITWGEMAPDQEYMTAGYEADDGGLDPYYALAKSFIDSSLPKKLPLKEAKNIMSGGDMISGAKDLAFKFIGFMICMVIGVLFIIIFPIVGCCFCCCRCCGNCGGKRLQKDDDKASCKRFVFSVILFVLAVFVLAGAACTFVTSNQMSKNIGGLNDSASDSIDDLKTFADNIDSQFRHIGERNFLFLSQVLKNYVGNASLEISDRIISAINQVVNLDGPLATIESLSGQTLTQITELEDKIKTSKSQRDKAVSNLKTYSGIVTEITKLENLPFNSMETKLKDFKSKVSTDVFKSMKEDLDAKIKTEVDKATQNIDVGTQLDKVYNDNIRPLLDKVNGFKTDTASDLDKYKEMVDKYTTLVKPYDKYRWYAGVGLASFLALIAVLMLFGVVLGVCCGSAKDRPTERGGASNCGGIMLMAAVGLIFIFGMFFMLLTTLMYMMGSITERYVCQTFDDLSVVEEYSSEFNFGMDLKNISFELNGAQINTGLAKLMDGCEKGETLYTVLGLEGVVNNGLAKIEDYKKDLNITGNMNVGQAATEAANSVDVASEIQALKDTQAALNDLKTSITLMKTEVQQTATDINTKTGNPQIGSTELGPLIATLGEMETIADGLIGTVGNIVTSASVVETRVNDTKIKLSDEPFMKSLIGNVTQSFVDTLFGFVDSYLADVKDKLANSVAKCTPIYSILNAVFSEALCHGIIDPMNGFWLAIGWCIFFFMPSLIFAVKLAKHFRRMLYEDSYLSPTTKGSEPPSYTEASAGMASTHPPLFPPNGNKVAPF